MLGLVFIVGRFLYARGYLADRDAVPASSPALRRT
jgi:hypothetical protein